MNIEKKIVAVSMIIVAVATSYLALQKYHDRTKAAYDFEQAFQDKIAQLDAKLLEFQALGEQEVLDEVIEQIEEELEQEVKVRQIIEITTQDALRAALHNDKQPSVIFFHMDGCGWCKKMAPVFEQVAQNQEFAGLQFYNVDGRSAQAPIVVKDLFNQQISGYPFFLFVDEKGFIDKQSGFIDQEKFKNKIKGLYPALFPNFVAAQVAEKIENRSGCGAHKQAEQNEQPALQKPDNIIAITSQDDVRSTLQNNKEKSVIFFHMDGCGWCKKMTPVFYAAAQNKDFSTLKFYTIDGRSTQAPIVVKELFDQQINGYPFLLFIDENGFVDKQSGFADQEKFENKIKESFFK
jgi:thiol-disulfide isomerase/thioredoxin